MSEKEWTLQVIVPGLVAHVPDAGGASWWMLMVRTDNVEGYSQHDPAVKFESRYLAGDQSAVLAPDAAELGGDGVKAQVVNWDATGRDVWFEPVGGATISPALQALESTGKLPEPHHQQKQELGFLASLEAIHQAPVQVDPGCFGADPWAANVAARIRVDRGVLGAWAFEEGASDPILPWSFKPEGDLGAKGTAPQPCAMSIVCEMKVAGGAIAVKAKRFGSDDERGFVVDAADGETVRLTVSNCPQKGEKVEILGDVQVDWDFLLYYQLTGPDAVDARAVPVRPDTDDTPKGTHWCCICARFTPRG